VADIKQYKTF